MAFDTPINDRYFEDYAPGSVHEFGTIAVDPDELSSRRLVEPDPLEVLERGAGRHELEVVVEGRDAHPGLPRQLLDAERPRVLGVDVPQDPGDSG